MKNTVEVLKALRLPHSLFSLPAVLSGSLLASNLELNILLKVVLATIFARTYGIIINDIVDLPYDIKNPRTKNRPLASGVLDIKLAKYLAISSAFLFITTCYTINKTCFLLSPVPILLFSIYPYLKRFTHLTHIYLGFSWSIGAIGGYLAVNTDISKELIYLYLTYATWLSGSDILYSTMDYQFDKKHGLYSIPQKLGIQTSIKISFLLHCISTYFFYNLTSNKLAISIFFFILLMQNIFWKNYKISFNFLNILLNFYIFIVILYLKSNFIILI
ncbi:MAG: putative 4-hydroxybenzoate polyprenyltransferase [bacterium]|nr:putative 4-hydroxybenzoate polyprenyltransferase [bacterium]